MPGKGPPGRRNDSKHFKHEKRRRELQKKERRDARAKAVAGRSQTADFAHDLLEAARTAPTAEGRTALAQEALRTDPDCADALVFLAEVAAATPEERLEHLQQAVAAGLRVLGDGLAAGGLGEQPLAQPYLRARLALAEALAAGGKAEEAVGHYEDLLRQNPTDEQGVRYALCCTLLGLGRADAAQDVLSQLVEETAESLYLRALVTFGADGDTTPARDYVGRARAAGPRLGDLLIGRTPAAPVAAEPAEGEDVELDDDEDEDGDDEAAVRYVRQTLPRWQAVPGALDWLKQVLGD